MRRSVLDGLGPWFGMFAFLVLGCKADFAPALAPRSSGPGPAGTRGEAPPHPDSNPPPGAPSPLAALLDEPLEPVELGRASAVVDLPHGSKFRLLSGPGTWQRLVRDDARLRVFVRHVAALRSDRAADCRREAELSLPELRGSGELLSERELSLAGDYNGSVEAALLGDGTGRVVASLAGPARCLVFVALVPREADLAARLGIFTERVVPSLGPTSVRTREERLSAAE